MTTRSSFATASSQQHEAWRMEADRVEKAKAADSGKQQAVADGNVDWMSRARTSKIRVFDLHGP
jgi:hypothetical protein